ncbi:MAG: glucans biosynthesis glucosyltransferase MdoH [Pseudomonadota bacterium]
MTLRPVPQTDFMPPQAPLEMATQALDIAPNVSTDTVASSRVTLMWRIALIGPALFGTALTLYGLYSWFMQMGMSWLEWCLLTLIGLSFIWVTLTVSTIGLAVAGLIACSRSATASTELDGPDLTVALLLPIYNEPTSNVFGNAAAMLKDISRLQSRHRYTLFVLSDSTNIDAVKSEAKAFAALREQAPDGVSVHYRLREENTDKKVGNLKQWITSWGAGYDAMLVLDADSLMAGRTIERLADALSFDPQAGLIQTCPMLISADTLFARLQQFSNIAYGWLLAEGLARWARGEGNYWGHNAIIRTRAFAASAGLPRLRGAGGRGSLILSHDFVEAGLLRRAGWRVRFLPRLSGSFEETPATLIDYVMRDQRWCRGNLQHLRLLGTAGLHLVSRFHLLQGAAGYLLSPAWFVLLVVWFLLGKDETTNVISYFSQSNPLFPAWPPEMTHVDSTVFLIVVYGLLLTPKLVGAGIIAAHPKAIRLYGGRACFLSAFTVEVLLSIAYAPILMVQQCRAVMRSMAGSPLVWRTQNRGATHYSLLDLLTFHWIETTLGLVLTAGLLSGLVSLWLTPIAGSLLLSVPLSALSSVPVTRALPEPMRMNSPLTLREPSIVTAARVQRQFMENMLVESHIAAK